MDRFIWDEAKNAENIRLRGISFEIVREIDWSTARIEDDERFDYGELRSRAFVRHEGKPYCFAFAP